MDEIINETILQVKESIDMLNESLVELIKVAAEIERNTKPHLAVDNIRDKLNET